MIMTDVPKMFCGGCPRPREFSETGGLGQGCAGPVETVTEGAAQVSTLHSVVRYQQATENFPPGRYCGRDYDKAQANINSFAELWASLRAAAEDATVMGLLSESYRQAQDTQASIAGTLATSVRPEAEQIPSALASATTSLDEAMSKEYEFGQHLNAYLQTNDYWRNPPQVEATSFGVLKANMDAAIDNPQNTVSIGMVAAEVHNEAELLSKAIGNVIAAKTIVGDRTAWLVATTSGTSSQHIEDALTLTGPYLIPLAEAESQLRFAFDAVVAYRP